MAAKFSLFQSTKNNQYYFTLKASQGEPLLQSEGYVTKQGAEGGIAAVKSAAPYDSQYRKYSSPWYFTLVAFGNSEVLGRSETYSSETARDGGIASVKANAPTAPVDDLVPKK